MVNLILVRFISCFVINYIFFKYLNTKYKLIRNGFYSLVILLLLTSVNTIANFFNIPILNVVLTIIVLLVLKLLLFNMHIKVGLHDDIIFLFITILLDSLCFYIAGVLYKNNNGDNFIQYFRTFMSTTLLVFFSGLFLRFMKQPRIDRVPKRELLVSFLITIFSVLLIYIFSIEYDRLEYDHYKLMTIFIIIGIIFINITIFHYLEYINHNFEMKESLLLEQENIKLTKMHYEDLYSQYSDTRKLIHDFKNYMIALDCAYRENNFDTAKKIMLEFSDECDSTRLKYNSGHKTLDIILNDKIVKAEKLSINISINVQKISMDFISELDMITIFGNLLDNAIEANESYFPVEDRFLKIQIYQVHQMIAVNISNACTNTLKYKNQILVSSKPEHYGIGLSSVKKIVEKYNASFDIQIEHNVCSALLCIPIKTQEY